MATIQHIPRSVRLHPMGEALMNAVRAALDSVDPEKCVEKHLCLEESILFAGPHRMELAASTRIRVGGGGKAGLKMANALHAALHARIEEGWVAVPAGQQDIPDRIGAIRLVPAAHPVPNQSSIDAARRVLQTARGLRAEDLLIVPISGGSSSLLTLPADGLTLNDLQTVTGLLLRSGTDITSINTIRKHLSAFKGGRLAAAAAPARILCLVLSDVVGDNLDAVGSGPTVPDPSTFSDAMAILLSSGIAPSVPSAVLDHLERGKNGAIRETPKPEDPLFERTVNLLIGGNTIAVDAAVDALNASGIEAVRIAAPLVGEASSTGEIISQLVRRICPWPPRKPFCLVFGGETTVTVRGSGKGGRNQETALAAALALQNFDNALVLTLATDGIDGPTDAAGAAAGANTLREARRKGLSPIDSLEKNDTYTFFESLDELLITGPTQTNVADLTFILLTPNSRIHE